MERVPRIGRSDECPRLRRAWRIVAIPSGLRAGCAALLLAIGAQASAQQAVSFVERPGAIPDLRAVFDEMGGSTFTTAMPIDLTGDGRLDLALHFYFIAYGSPGSFTPCTERLVLLVQASNGTFSDQTATLLEGPPRLGACMSWHDVADYNGDGRPDLAIAASQEDGRDTSNPAWMNAQSVVLLSNVATGKYTLERVGTPNWFHMVGHAIAQDGRPLLAISGYTQGSEIWRRDVAGWTRLSAATAQTPPGSTPYPHVDANAFVFLDASGAQGPSDTLVKQSPFPTGFSAMDGAVRSTAGSWDPVTQLEMFPFVGMVRFVNWQGNESNAPVYRVDGRDAVAGGFLGGCKLRLGPAVPPMAVMKLSIAYIPGGWVGPQQLVHENDLLQSTRVFGFRAQGGSVVRTPLPVDGEVHEGISARYLRCADINADGLADLTVSRFGVPNPFVYINTGDGMLRYAGESAFPAHTPQWNHAGTSLLVDFNGDGVADLLRWPGAGWSSQFGNDVSFRYFEGTAHLTAEHVFRNGFEAQ
jgi:hypothetical protein